MPIRRIAKIWKSRPAISPSWILELRAPQGAPLDALRPLLATLLSYLLRFVCLGSAGTITSK